ncbi:MAG: alanine--tRNA ligase [Opitutales bacterium]|nr:alanine--tRNA ligase [Opitutales bacterium]
MNEPVSSQEFQDSFLKFFEDKSHKILPSTSLRPTAPNLLFTNAGMNEFVPYFLGETAPYPRIVKSQRCLRAGGKHNDLEDVGFDGYHHTAFEMLGNWSFGDYFKEEAISWAWELLTKAWGLPKERLFVTVYKPNAGEPGAYDEESYRIWENVLKNDHLDPALHIVYGSKKDNFWSMGDTGPCGPCSEIHINCSPDPDIKKGRALVNAGSPWCIELWNLVFMQYNANPDSSFTPLNNHYVDTGMGLERLAGIAASTDDFHDFSKLPSNYASDLFTPCFDIIRELCGYRYQGLIPNNRTHCTEAENKDCACRILADHMRAAIWAIGDRIHPGNTGREYTIRHILRRAMLFAKRLGIPAGSLAHFSTDKYIQNIIAAEENKFSSALDRGLAYINQEGITKRVTGEQAFKLYDTYGFPFELTQFIAQDHGWSVDCEGFQRCMEEQKQRSKANTTKSIVQAKVLTNHESKFIGYDNWLDPQKATLLDDVRIEDKTYLIFDKTPFYAESGGQAGDKGSVTFDGNTLEIVNTIRQNAAILHELEHDEAAKKFFELKKTYQQEGSNALKASDGWTLEIDAYDRQACSANHTATHLLYAVLRKKLGGAVKQLGSKITAENLTFDFSYPHELNQEKLIQIEIECNECIWPYKVKSKEGSKEKLINRGTIADFTDKYGAIVRKIIIGKDENHFITKDICGGTHVKNTLEIGIFHITKAQSIGSGIKRIEAVTWNKVSKELMRLEHGKRILEQYLSMPIEQIGDAYQKLLKQDRRKGNFLEKALQTHGGQCLKESTHDGLNYVQWETQVIDPNTFRKACKAYLGNHPEIDVLWGATQDNDATVTVFLFCSQAAVNKGVQAGAEIQKFAARCASKGGGKPDFASCSVPESEFKQHWGTILS